MRPRREDIDSFVEEFFPELKKLFEEHIEFKPKRCVVSVENIKDIVNNPALTYG
jgi:hypothetical protein